MTVEWNGESFKLAMRQAVAKGLTETAIAAENIARVRMPPAIVAVRTQGKGGTVYATPSSTPGGYPGRRTGSLVNSLTTSVATPDNLRAAFGVFGGQQGPRRFILDGSGADGYPKFLEFGTRRMAARPWAKRTITENQQALSARFTQAARREFARAAPR